MTSSLNPLPTERTIRRCSTSLLKPLDQSPSLGLTWGVPFYALTATDSDFAIDLYPSLEQAATALRQVIADEPGFEPLLRIEAVDLTGWAESISLN